MDLFIAVSKKELSGKKVEISGDSCVTVMLVSGGYPEVYEKGKIITNMEVIEDSLLFHAGTTLDNGEIKTNGGRVIAVSSLSGNFRDALKKSFRNAEIVTFDKKYYRSDIGFDL